MLNKRTLGHTGFQVTEIGLGAWPLGSQGYGKDIPDEEALACIEAYVEGGGNFIDTARRYGESERLIGEYFQKNGKRADVILASKSHRLDAAELREELETSLRQLQTDYIDLYFLHAPPYEPDEMNRVLDTYERFKDEGKIRAIGASIKGPDVNQRIVNLCRQYMRTGRVDALQIIYSIFRQKNREIFNEAIERGVGIVARTALESGFLTGKYAPDHRFGEDDHRQRWGHDHLNNILKETQNLKDTVIEPPYENLTQVAIRFALAPEAVSTVILGAKTERQVKANLRAGSLPALAPEMVERLIEQYYGRSEEFNTV